MNFDLRPYQTQSVINVENTLSGGNRSALVVLATGCGKTIVFSSLIENEVNRGGRVLVLAHRNKLLEQAHDKLYASCGINAHYDGKEGGDDSVIISSVQAMSRDNRLSNYPDGYFSMIVVDEAHHIASPSYKKVVEHFESAKLVGVTATPVRGDKLDVGELFDEVCYEYGMLEAIQDGYLAPLHTKKCKLNIDISNVHLQSGDFSAGELGEAIEPYLMKIADQIRIEAPNKKTIIFVPLVSTAQKLSNILNEKGFRAEYVSGERKESDEILEQFEHGQYDIVVNSMLLTEGYDCPSIDCVINLRPTKSESLYTQIIGRGTRLHSGKDSCLVLDFLWQDNGRGQLDVQDVVNEGLNDELKNKMAELVRSGEEFDVVELKERAVAELQKEQEQRLIEAIQKANLQRQIAKQKAEMELARQRERETERIEIKRKLLEYAKKKSEQTGKSIKDIRGVIKPKPKVLILYDCYTGTPLQMKVKDKGLEALGLNMFEPYYPSDMDDASQEQLALLKKFGISSDLIACKGQASEITNALISRKNRHLGSYKQVCFLVNHKIANAEFFTDKECKSIMASLSSHGWKMNRETASIINKCREDMEM